MVTFDKHIFNYCQKLYYFILGISILSTDSSRPNLCFYCIICLFYFFACMLLLGLHTDFKSSCHQGLNKVLHTHTDRRQNKRYHIAICDKKLT